MPRTVLYGFNAWVGSYHGATAVKFWPVDPATIGYDPNQLISVDLSKCPQAVRNNQIALSLLQCDDYQGWGNYGQTRIGPSFPGGTMTGTCWLEQAFYNAIPNPPGPPPRLPPGAQCHDYEFTNLLDWDRTTTTARYQGTYASIVAINGNLAEVSVWLPGTSRIPGQPPIGTYWIDLSTAGYDPISKGYTQIGIGAGQPRQGALFVAYGGVIPLSPPKNPVALGGVVPARRHVDR